VVRLSRRKGLQAMLGAAQVVLLASCKAGRGSPFEPSPRIPAVKVVTPPPNGGDGLSDGLNQPNSSEQPDQPKNSEQPAPVVFKFVTISNPPVDHTGVTSRPRYSPTDPRSASVIDPMSGITLFRLGGDFGGKVYIDGTWDTGLVWPHRLRNENSPEMQKVWNADGSLLMIDRYFAASGDPSNSAKSLLIDVAGTHGASVPWRIIRASRSAGLGDGVGNWWMWDPNKPLRAFVIRDNGQVDEWWPIGDSGHSVGEVNTLHGPTPGYGGHNQGRRHMLQTSHDGLYYISGCRETDGERRWGGLRIDLRTGALRPFRPTPDTFNTDPDRCSRGTSWTGTYTSFSPDGSLQHMVNVMTGVESPTIARSNSHQDWTIVNGVEYWTGPRTDVIVAAALPSGAERTLARIPGSNPNHCCSLNNLDLFETYGAAGGANSGQRYIIYARSNPRNGHPRAIIGIRQGPNDMNVLRYICNHRSVRTSNYNEVHPQISRDAKYIVFPSNWLEPGVTTDGDVHPYVALIPDAWYSTNNSGV
jgi:hypothetical protein